MGPHRFNSKFFALDLTADFMTRTGRQLSPRLPEWSELFGKVNPGGAGLFIGGLEMCLCYWRSESVMISWISFSWFMLVHFIITSIQSCEWESKQSPRVSKCQNVSKKLTRSGEDPRLWYYELRQRTSKLAKSRQNLENHDKNKKSWFFPVHLLGQISIYLTSAFFRICCANQILIICFHFCAILILDFFLYGMYTQAKIRKIRKSESGVPSIPTRLGITLRSA